MSSHTVASSDALWRLRSQEWTLGGEQKLLAAKVDKARKELKGQQGGGAGSGAGNADGGLTSAESALHSLSRAPENLTVVFVVQPLLPLPASFPFRAARKGR